MSCLVAAGFSVALVGLDCASEIAKKKREIFYFNFQYYITKSRTKKHEKVKKILNIVTLIGFALSCGVQSWYCLNIERLLADVLKIQLKRSFQTDWRDVQC
jgi:hypothetical protein